MCHIAKITGKYVEPSYDYYKNSFWQIEIYEEKIVEYKTDFSKKNSLHVGKFLLNREFFSCDFFSNFGEF